MATQQDTTAAEAVNWRKATREDVLAAYAIFRRHHPGMFDPHNPRFPQQLRHARDAALAFGEKANDAEGHMRALGVFSAVLADAHARVQVAYNGQGVVLWPGFRTAWRGGSLHVLNASQGGPSPGAVLLACDGRGAREVIRKVAFSNYGRPNEEGQWWVFAPGLFVRVKSPYETLPRRCSFRDPDGHQASYSLDWQPVPPSLWKSLEAQSKREPVALTHPRPGMYLITLSTFSPDEQGRAQYDRLFRDIDENIGSMTAARAIVIDLRHNQGGSSSWGDDVAEHVWGEAAVKSKLADYFRNTQVWWLADQANIAHWREVAVQFRAEGRPQVNDGIGLNDLASRLEQARERGKHFYVEDYGATLAREATNAEPRRLPPVYAIMDGGCVSACLDALDLFTRFSGVKLMGAPTSADSAYIDIRFQPLPSGRGAVILPTKIWVHRPRRAGEIYRPDIPVNDLDWTTATMLDHVERDLTHYRSRH